MSRHISEVDYRVFGPYGYLGNDLGRSSLEVLADLSDPVPDSWMQEDKLIVWSKDDASTFANLIELESFVLLLDPHPELEGGDIADLHRAVGRFNVALPLSDAERYWLFHPLGGEGLGVDFTPVDLIGVAKEVTSAGIKQVIQGRDVVRRLATWRREADEFANQGTLDEAREALGEIALTLVTEANWPTEHQGLLTKLRGE